MRKLFISLCLLCIGVGAQAQFEQGKWVVNPCVTGLNFSNSDDEDSRFGVHAQIGAFVVDNTALMVTLGGEWTDLVNVYNGGVGGRYYFEHLGIYLGAGLKVKHWKFDHAGSNTDFAAFAEAGYAFFITKTVTLEPAIYYDLSFKDSDYSKFGVKIGFGIYF